MGSIGRKGTDDADQDDNIPKSWVRVANLNMVCGMN